MTAGLGADAAAFAAIAVLGGLVWIAGSAALGPAPAAERVGVGILCLAAGAWLVMLQPLAGVSVVGAPWVLRAILVVVLAFAVVRRSSLRLSGIGVAPAVAITAAGLVVSAAAWLVPGDDYPARYTDILWHEGWIRQLVGGGKAPGGVYADVPNAYPWLEHALAALIMSTGGLAMTPTLIAVEAVMLAALATGTWLLAVELELGPRRRRGPPSWRSRAAGSDGSRPPGPLRSSPPRAPTRPRPRPASCGSSAGSATTAATSCSRPRRPRRSAMCRPPCRASWGSRCCRSPPGPPSVRRSARRRAGGRRPVVPRGWRSSRRRSRGSSR